MNTEPEYIPPTTFRGYLKELKGTWNTIRYTFALADSRDARPWLYQKYFFIIAAVALSMATPKMIGLILEGAAAGNKTVVAWSSAGLLGLFFARHIMEYIQAVAHEHLWGRALRNISVRIAERFFEKSPGQHRHVKTLNFESMNKGRNKAIDIYTGYAPETVQTVATLVLAFCFIAMTSTFGAMVLGGALVLHVLWSLHLNHQMAVISTPIEREFSAFERFLAERFRLFERVFVSGKRSFEQGRIRDRWWSVAIKDRVCWIAFLRNATYAEAVLAVIVCGMLYHETVAAMENGTSSVGLLYPLFAWSTQIYSDMWRIRHLERRVYGCIPAIAVMRETLDIPPDVVDLAGAIELGSSVAPQQTPLTLTFHGVSYSYPGSESTLKGVSFSVGPGEKVALVGPTGSGKSTIEYLALRFMDPQSGSISIDGVDIRKYKLAALHRAIGYIPQKPLIFDGTVRENLLYSLDKKAMTNETVSQIPQKPWLFEGTVWDHPLSDPIDEKEEGLATDIVTGTNQTWTDERLTELMCDLAIDFGVRPAGENPLDIVVGRDGIQLSGGQAQRLAIGAAVIKQPRLLIVDEATSALDSATETRVLDGLRKWIDGAGILVIAHRLSTVQDATRIIVLTDGTIEAVGTSFGNLVEQSPTFRKLISGQQHLLG